MGAAFFSSLGTITQQERAPLQDHCGIVAAFSSENIPFFPIGLRGLSILQTRGYDGAGFCALDTDGHLYQFKATGMVREVFSKSKQDEFQSIAARSWVYQVRYGTSGAFITDNVQPMIGIHKETGDTFVVAHNGQFSITPETEDIALSDTWVFCEKLRASNLPTWEQRIAGILTDMKGAWSLVISTKDALYVARDPWGFRPFVYGHIGLPDNPIWVAASETSSLDAMGATEHFELMPGTIAKITKNGLSIIAKHTQKLRALCIFENIYLQHGAGKAHLPRKNQRSIKKAPSVDDVRRRSGRELAKEAPLTKLQVDMVIGVPGTGIEGGMQYARALDLPYFQAITDRVQPLSEQRTFMTSDIDGIYKKVLEHFSFDKQALLGRRVVLVDDSIVRGNITRGLIYLLKNEYGVPSVHIRILSPAIDKTCHLGVNTRHTQELIAARFDGDVIKIQEELGADTLEYLSAQGLKFALTGDTKAQGFCMGCMVGMKPPIDKFGNPVRLQTKIPKYLYATL